MFQRPVEQFRKADRSLPAEVVGIREILRSQFRNGQEAKITNAVIRRDSFRVRLGPSPVFFVHSARVIARDGQCDEHCLDAAPAKRGKHPVEVTEIRRLISGLHQGSVPREHYRRCFRTEIRRGCVD